MHLLRRAWRSEGRLKKVYWIGGGIWLFLEAISFFAYLFALANPERVTGIYTRLPASCMVLVSLCWGTLIWKCYSNSQDKRDGRAAMNAFAFFNFILLAGTNVAGFVATFSYGSDFCCTHHQGQECLVNAYCPLHIETSPAKP